MMRGTSGRGAPFNVTPLRHRARGRSVRPPAGIPHHRDGPGVLARPGLPIVSVQHYPAHIASLLADKAVEGEVRGVVREEIGHADEGTVLGGEFLVIDAAGYRRYACLLE